MHDQQSDTDYRYDLGWKKYRLLAEYDGEEFHLHDRRTFQRDRQKGNFAAQQGYELLRFTKRDLYARRNSAVQQLKRALIRRGWRPDAA